MGESEGNRAGSWREMFVWGPVNLRCSLDSEVEMLNKQLCGSLVLSVEAKNGDKNLGSH